MNTPPPRNTVFGKFVATVTTGTTSYLTRNSTLNGYESILQDSSVVKIAVIGATGAGKSKFIHLLTEDNKIQIGDTLKSQTSDVQMVHYRDPKTGCSVMLIDTPGLDNSRDDITDTDILQKIITFLTPKGGGCQKLNGIIYMHRINDPRKASHVPKNLGIFRQLCGDENLRHVRLVTTHWDDADEEMCTPNEGDLKKDTFRILLAAGAQMRRHTNTVESAQAIVSELTPLPKISIQLQDEAGRGTLIGETDVGRIINDNIEELKKKHAEELADLEKQTEEAVQACEDALIAELDGKRKALEEKVAHAEEAQERLKMTVEELRKQQEVDGEVMEGLRAAFAEGTAKLKDDHERALEAARCLREQVESAEKQRQEDIAEQQKRRDEDHAATARREERQEEIARLVDAEQKVADLQKRIEEIEAEARNLEGFARRFIGTMAWIYVVALFVVVPHVLGYVSHF